MTDLYLSGQNDDQSGGSNWLQLALDLANATDRPGQTNREGRRLTHVQVLTARPGQPISRVFGRMRIGGQIIWHGPVREHITESGGDDGDKGSDTATPLRRDYRYSLSLAIALCEGPVSHIGRVWADGQLLSPAQLNLTLHSADKHAAPDPIIENHMGVGRTPAFRGLSYVLLRNLDVTAFGNRLPQLSFEVFCPIDDKAPKLSAVCLLPGASEFAYHPEPHIQVLGIGHVASENITAQADKSDWSVSLDQLQEAHADCRKVALVVTWFGTDLRADKCRLLPKVDNKEKGTLPTQWQVAGLNRKTAALVSAPHGYPAFGGTPSDASVLAALADLKQRGFEVMFYPFIMMDIAPDNKLPDPYGGAAQAAYPWRGRITAADSAQQGTHAVTRQIESFVNGRGASDRFCLRGMVRHYAALCAQAGGVESFLLASELPALSRLHDAAGHYPFAEHLVSLAAEVRRHLPETAISYAADWTEYGAHEQENGDVGFPLDGFWSDENCAFIGIDAYWPLADWRDGPGHKDAANGAVDIYDAAYLQSNLRGGEYFDWYYASAADRQAQKRTPITDGQGEPWLYRSKDIANWWQHAHHPRRDGKRQVATAWRPRMKPFRLTELGCPAVDKGANQPNVFPDTVSSEGGVPYFSNGARDDYMQSAYIGAVQSYYAEAAHNPRSPVYGGPMLSLDDIYIWAWDARPFPHFPYRLDVWRDGDNWHTGHWLNGRYASAPLRPLLQALAGQQKLLVHQLGGVADGYALRGVTSLAEDLQPLLRAFSIDALVGRQHIRLHGRGERSVRDITADDLVLDPRGRVQNRTRTISAGEEPRRFDLHYLDGENDYGATHVSARHDGGDEPVAQLTVPLAMTSRQATQLANRLLYEARGESETLTLTLSPQCLDIEAGDIIRHADKHWRVRRVSYGTPIELHAMRHHPGLYGAFSAAGSTAQAPSGTGHITRPALFMLDLPAPALRYHSQPVGVPLLAAFATPWPGQVAVEAPPNINRTLRRPSVVGHTLTELPVGPVGRWDRGTYLDIELAGGAVAAEPALSVLAGGNRLAIATNGGWEIVQFARAELIGARRYRLTHMLRGQFGSDDDMAAILAVGAPVVLLGGSQIALTDTLDALPEAVTLHHGSDRFAARWLWLATTEL